MMNISIIGTGYVGLVSGVCLSDKGHNVVCVDNNEAKVSQINKGISPIHEDGLDKLLNKNIGQKLRASSEFHNSIMNSSVSIIAVGTPFDGNLIDLKFVREVSKEIGISLKEKNDFHVVIVKSTVVPGTTDDVVIPILEKYSGKGVGRDFGVGMNPEFLREGVAVDDFMHPDRIVLGASDDLTHNIMKELYKVFKNSDILLTNNKTAEMIKYTSNSLLATLISFSNEIANLCSSIQGIDVVDVMKGVHLDKRVSPILSSGKRIKPGIASYIEAGCGFGGSCFPKDVKALISHGENENISMPLLKSVIEINNKQPQKMIDLLLESFPDIKDLNIAILGLAFKPGTDDMRESPSLFIVNEVHKLGGKINAYDPVAEVEAKIYFANLKIKYHNNIKDAVINSDVIMILTSWPEFKNLPKIISEIEENPLIIDGRRMFNKLDFKNYKGIGFQAKLS
jgi:UDPglucose 6-dehydrogenase